MEKNRISMLQLVILLFLSRQFTSLTYSPGIGTAVSGTATLYSYLIGAGVLLLLFLPLVIMANKYPERSVVMNLQAEFRGFGIFGGFLYYGYLVLSAAHTLAQFQFFMTNAVFPDASVWVILLPMLLVAVYAASVGIEGIARSGFLIFIGFVIAVAVILFSSIPNVELKNVYPLEQNRLQEIAMGTYGVVSRSAEPILFALLLPYVGGRTGKATVGFTLLSAAVQELTAFFILTVLGRFSYSQTFPFYSLASISEISIFHRMDALYMGIWVLVGFIKLALLLALANDTVKFLLPKRKNGSTRRFTLFATSVLVLTAAIPACYSLRALSMTYQLLFNGVVVLLLTVVLPIAVQLKAALSKRKSKGRSE